MWTQRVLDHDKGAGSRTTWAAGGIASRGVKGFTRSLSATPGGMCWSHDRHVTSASFSHKCEVCESDSGALVVLGQPGLASSGQARGEGLREESLHASCTDGFRVGSSCVRWWPLKNCISPGFRVRSSDMWTQCVLPLIGDGFFCFFGSGIMLWVTDLSWSHGKVDSWVMYVFFLGPSLLHADFKGQVRDVWTCLGGMRFLCPFSLHAHLMRLVLHVWTPLCGMPLLRSISVFGHGFGGSGRACSHLFGLVVLHDGQDQSSIRSWSVLLRAFRARGISG